MNPRIRTMALRGNGGGAPIFNPSFTASYQDSPTVVTQSGQTPSVNTRPSIAAVTDWEGVTREVLSGENRFGGMRRVRNLIPLNSGFLGGTPPTSWTRSASGGTETAADSTVYGGHKAITFTIANQREILNQIVNVEINRKYRISFYCSAVSGGSFVDYSALLVTQAGGTMNVTVGILSSVCVAGKRMVSVVGTCTATGTMQIRYGFGCGATETATGSITIEAPMLEDITGQSNQNPSEYVSVGVLSSPFQGANVDGVQYFATQNGNTVASNVVTEATGALISSAIRGGYLPEPAATDLLLARADARNQTTANWTLGATMARARTQTGWDGVANRATLFTAGAVAATNRCSMTFALAAANRTFSIGMKRGVGTGPVLITGDGFATTTDISAQLNTSTFTLVQIAANVLNPVIGWQVSTQNDTIITDWAQYSTGDLTGAGIINSRIPDTITTRNADVASYATTGWYNTAVGTLFVQFIQPPNDGVSHVVAQIDDGTTANMFVIYRTGATNIATIFVGGVQKFTASLAAPAAGTVCKIAMAWAVNDGVAFQNNSAMTIGTAGTTLPAGITTLSIGHETSVLQQATYNQKDAYYPTRLPNSVAQALTV